ncbi:MAG: tripartite tricarboxylate transporter TctB family protein [Thermodesulfobacteriota bacterium]
MRTSERITALVTSIAGAAVMVYGWRTLNIGSIHVPDAGFFPFLCGAGLTILGVVWMWILQFTREKAAPAQPRRWHRPVLSLALMVLYGWAMESVGYISSTLVFMVAWQKVIEGERWPKTLVISLLGSLAMYALFVFFLKVPVPPELFLR